MAGAKEVRRGMPADEVLKMRGRSADHAIASPKVISEDPLVVSWHYPDCDLILRRWNGRYRVAEVLWSRSA